MDGTRQVLDEEYGIPARPTKIRGSDPLDPVHKCRSGPTIGGWVSRGGEDATSIPVS